MFNHDWFNGAPYQQQVDEARFRCARFHYPDLDPEDWDGHEEVERFLGEVEVRTLVYLRDGFSYEIKEFADLPSKSHLVFECLPIDDSYRVGSFVVTVPYEEIVRVEVFAVHASEKPSDSPQITGFRSDPHEMRVPPK